MTVDAAPVGAGAVAAPPLRASIDLPPVPLSVPVARRVVRELLTGWSAEVFCDDTLLLLSELVSNVVRHVPDPDAMRVELALTGPVLEVAVLDGSAAPPVLGGGDGNGGRGLQLVSAMSDRWGSHRHVQGKRVWFELRCAG